MTSVPALTSESRIKRRVRDHLRRLGFSKSSDGTLAVPTTSKDDIRRLHASKRHELIRAEQGFIDDNWPDLIHHFADGSDVEPCRISPKLEPVLAGTEGARLFRFAALTWSVPVSRGYGRRLRFLIRDESNGKLLGLISLTDPVFNLNARDQVIGWNAAERGKRLKHVLDANVLGALPPYNQILCGKLVAALLRTTDLRDAFASRYANRVAVISRRQSRSRLVLITTSSALGRSSVYNRLCLDGSWYLKRVGTTSGWGHFHVSEPLFQLLREHLLKIGHPYATKNRFGDGPNWRFRVIRAGLQAVGMSPDLLRHGIKRELFFCELASNAMAFLRCNNLEEPDYEGLESAADVSAMALERWTIPRARWDTSYCAWRRTQLRDLLGSPRAASLLSQKTLHGTR